MTNNFVFKSNILYRDGERFLSFPSSINEILVIKNRVIILLQNSSPIGNQNIFCFDFQKNQIWQISKPVELHYDNYFSAIYLRDDELYAYNINGIEYHLDKETGDILDTELIK
jgi:hypothetical protein